MNQSILRDKLTFLYGEVRGTKTAYGLQKLLETAKKKNQKKGPTLWSEKDVALITYADSFQEKGVSPLKTLDKFLEAFVKNHFSIVHILPFFPYTSDRGFSVVDYYKVKKEFGSWRDIKKIGQSYRLMADLVSNHVSTGHKWFQKFLGGDRRYQDYFIWFAEARVPWEELKKVLRSRPTPVVTPFETKMGKRFVWTTYSVFSTNGTDVLTDQVDLNYHNPEVLIEMVRAFLNLLGKGIEIVRFDAIGSAWKELGTTCRFLPQTHALMAVYRQILEMSGIAGLIVTESSMVNHEQNIAFLGDGFDEAHLVYNFPLSPLTLQAFYSGSARHLTAWASRLVAPSERTTFFNFLDNHDGVETTGGDGYISEEEKHFMIEEAAQRGAVFSYKTLPRGGKGIKELHMTWWSAINKDNEPFNLQLRKFITSRAITMALPGIPLIYYLSLFGAKNDSAAAKRTGVVRDIQRTDLSFDGIAEKLGDKESREFKIFSAMMALIKRRKAIPQLHPNAKMEVLSLDRRLFSIIRESQKEKLLALHNVSGDNVKVTYQGKGYSLKPYSYLWKTL